MRIGVDLGGTKIEAALVDKQGNISFSHRNPTHAEKGTDNVISNLTQCINICRGKGGKKVKYIGIGMAGQIGKDTVIVHSSPNLGWRDVPLKSTLEKSLSIPVAVTNDVRAAA